MPDYTSPDVRNYAVLKGNIYFTPAGGDPVNDRRHLGNVPEGEFEPSVEVIDHFSAMEGVRTKDFTATLQKTATLTLTIEELTAANFSLALMGDVETDSDGNKVVDILSTDVVRGRVEIVGTNDIGPKMTWNFPSVAFRPSGAISFIGDDDWSNIEVTGEVEAVNGSFGTITWQDSAESEPVS